MTERDEAVKRDGSPAELRQTDGFFLTRAPMLALSLLCLALPAMALLWTISHHTLPYGDEAEYLELARSLRDGRGYVSRIHWLYGTNEAVGDIRPEANRAPALPWLISCYWRMTERMPIFWLQMINGLFFLAALTLLGLFLQRRVGPLIAWLTVLLSGLSPLNLWLASRLLPESIFFLLFVICLWIMAKGSEERMSWQRLFLLGMFCGVAGYIRPNGNLLLIGFIIVLLSDNTISYRLRLSQSMLISVVWLAVRSPWLIRNHIVFGSPWYDELGYFIWVDRFNDAFGIHAFEPSALSYLSNHGIPELVFRFARGTFLVLESLTAGNIFSGELHLIGPLAPLWVTALFCFGYLWSDRALRGWFFICVVHGVVFAWIGMGGLIRYLYLCFPLVIVAGLWGTAFLSQRLGRRTSLPIIIMVSAVLFLQARPLVLELRKDDRQAMLRQEELMRKLDEIIPADEKVMAFPDLGGLSWRGSRSVLYIPSGGLEAIQEVLRRYSCRTVVLSVKTLFYRPCLQEWWLDTTNGRLMELHAPPNWRLLAACGDSSILIYRVSDDDRSTEVPAEIESVHDMY